MSYKLLYVEDEPFLAQIVSDGLSSSGYQVFLADNGRKGLALFEKEKPDICVLDIMLPELDGYELAEQIRISSPEVPIIFLSAKSLASDVVKGFKTGGNDYLKKPFSIEELLVRLEYLLTRFSNVKPINYQFGNCTLDPLKQILNTSDHTYQLSFKESALLELLLQRRDAVLERREALKKIWGLDGYYNTRSMDVFMGNLRKFLKDEQGIQLIGIRGIGYKLVVDQQKT